MNGILNGTIVNADMSGLTIHVPYSDWQKFAKQNNTGCLVQLSDGRGRSLEQNKMAWALMTDIAEYQSGDKRESEAVYHDMRIAYTTKQIEQGNMAYLPRKKLSKGLMVSELQNYTFHLSSATMEQTTGFINMLVDTIIEYGIPTKEPLQKTTDDIKHYVWQCAMHKRCASCGKGDEYSAEHAEVHHIERVGMGRDRKHMNHIGMPFLPLCRTCHQEAHRLGDDTFMELMHLEPIEITKQIVKKYNLSEEE